MKRILIIGAKGFIGSHAINYFRSKKHEVWACDIVNDYVDPNYIQIDALSTDFSQLFREHSFDACINCSGAADVRMSFEKPAKDFELNVNNVSKILTAIKNFNAECQFINLSSAAVYGNPENIPVKEDAPLSPLSPYGRHKMMSEEICTEFHELFQLKTCSVRIFSAYGPGLKKQLFWDLYQKSLGKEQVELLGTGNESRDFIYVNDILLALETLLEKGEFQGEVYNLARGEEVTIKEVVSLFYQLLGWKGKIEFDDQNPKGYPNNWAADISKLKKLGFAPGVSMEDGLKKYIEWLGKEKE